MKKLIIIVVATLLFGCNTTPRNKTTNSEANKKTTEIANTVGSTIAVTLTGGANAGAYHITSKETTCSEGLTGDNSFGNQYSEKGKPDNELSSLQLIIDDKDAAKKGTDRFSLSIGFGKIIGGKTYTISTRSNDANTAKKGSGKATYSENGKTKTVTIVGKTADGVGISASITCYQIMTANGIQ